MKFETYFLRGLFGVCVLVCGLTLLAMVTAKPASTLSATGHSVVAVTGSTTGHAETAV